MRLKVARWKPVGGRWVSPKEGFCDSEREITRKSRSMRYRSKTFSAKKLMKYKSTKTEKVLRREKKNFRSGIQFPLGHLSVRDGLALVDILSNPPVCVEHFQRCGWVFGNEVL